MSALELAEMASAFPKLRQFVYVSTAYCNSNLPDGIIEEKIYPLGNAEDELKEIVATGTTSFAAGFPWPYGYGKHLTERLLRSRFPQLPLIIMRPPCIGPAVSQPYPLYGPMGGIPIEQLFRLLTLSPGTGKIHALEGGITGENILDQIPVDWHANLILLHVAAGTRGVVQACADLFIPRTFDHHFHALLDNDAKAKLSFIPRRGGSECFWPDYYKVLTRGWVFLTSSSDKFRNLSGPLGISLKGVDLEEYDRGRRRLVQNAVAASKIRSKL